MVDHTHLPCVSALTARSQRQLGLITHHTPNATDSRRTQHEQRSVNTHTSASSRTPSASAARLSGPSRQAACQLTMGGLAEARKQ